MQDLINFSSLGFENDDGNSTNRLERDINKFYELEHLDKNKKFLYRKPTEERNNETEGQIPLVSEISGYIEHKKLELQKLNINIKKLLQEKEELEERKNTILSIITNLERKESQSLTYLNWFNSLKNELWKFYGIRLEEEFDNFIKVFTDFKHYNFEAHQIVKEYKEMESLREEMKLIQGIVDSHIKTRDDLPLHPLAVAQVPVPWMLGAGTHVTRIGSIVFQDGESQFLETTI